MTKNEEGVRNLDQVENLVIKLEKGTGDLATKKAVLILARAVWWLLERWLREHESN